MIDSIWAQGTKLPEFGQLKQDRKTDVLIVGGGLAGILCAWELKQAGVDCALIEADRICHGVTRNTTAKITSQHGLIYGKLCRMFGTETARLYYEANEAALRALCELAGKYDCGLEEKHHYVYTTGAPADLEKELRALTQAGIPARFTDTLPLPFPVTGAIGFAGQAQFNPLRFVCGIAKDLPIFENTKATAFAENTVITEHGKITASKIIVATHFPILNKHGGYFLKMYQQRSYAMALENGPQVDGMYLGVGENDLSLRNYDGALLVGGGGHRTGKKGAGWKPLEDFAQSYCPESKVLCRWATQDCMSLDGIPYIGRYGSRTRDLYVATGFNKWGMTSSMLAAVLLRDLVCGRENPYASVFSPQRTALRPQLAGNILKTTVNLLTPTRPRCPHLGCALKWNRQERSWDCPCHGSRFSETGKVLDNPATGDMKEPFG